MALSNIVGFFIIVTTAATLQPTASTRSGPRRGRRGVASDLPGDLAFLLFSLGIIGTGLLAMPALPARPLMRRRDVRLEGKPRACGRSRALGFYPIIGGATLVGALGAMTPIDPITMLVWSAVFNGIVAAPLMVGMMLVVTNRRIMGEFAAAVLASFRLAGDAAHGPSSSPCSGHDAERLNAPQVSTMPA